MQKIPILHGMGGASRQSGGAAVAASTDNLNTHSADIMRVDVLTAHTPFCTLAAWLRTDCTIYGLRDEVTVFSLTSSQKAISDIVQLATIIQNTNGEIHKTSLSLKVKVQD